MGRGSASGQGFDAHGLMVLVLLAATITLALQAWLGAVTIYSPDLDGIRLTMHRAIIANTPPEGGWAAIGGAAVNIRITAVHAAQLLHEASGFSILRSYMILDTVFLFIALIGIALYLQRWMSPAWCLLGMLYSASILPLSYFEHFFHPWDRMHLVVWLLILAAIRDARFWGVFLGLAAAMTIKFDTVLIALLYGMTHIGRDRVARTLIECAALVVVAWAVLAVLHWALPAPAEPARFSVALAVEHIAMNLQQLATLNVRHPVLLAWGPMALFAFWGLRRRPRFVIAGVAFALVLSVVWGSFTVFREMRAQMPLLLLLLPPALMTLRDWLEPSPKSLR